MYLIGVKYRKGDGENCKRFNHYLEKLTSKLNITLATRLRLLENKIILTSDTILTNCVLYQIVEFPLC